MQLQSPRIEIRRSLPNQKWTYADLDARQRVIAAEVRDTRAPGALLFSEVAPVITYGRRTAATDLHLTPEQAEQAGVQLLPVDRGGMATYHGTGQWVVFPVDTLSRLVGDSRGVRKVVEALLESVAKTAREVVGPENAPSIQVKEGCETGVWWSHRKIASVGIHIQDGVLHHGLALNGFATPQSFVGLRPCGLDAEVGYLLPTPDEVRFLQIRDLLEKNLLATLWRTPLNAD